MMPRAHIDHKRRAEALARQLVARARAEGRELLITDIIAAKGAHPKAILAALDTKVAADKQ